MRVMGGLFPQAVWGPWWLYSWIHAGRAQLWNGTWSPWTTFRTAMAPPPAPTISCPRPYTKKLLDRHVSDRRRVLHDHGHPTPGPQLPVKALACMAIGCRSVLISRPNDHGRQTNQWQPGTQFIAGASERPETDVTVGAVGDEGREDEVGRRKGGPNV